MKYFVTGGAGFIGSHLVDKLILTGNTVTVYDNLSGGSLDFISQHLDNPDFKLVEASLLDQKRLEEAVQGHDFVFHLAANPDIRKSSANPWIDIEQGILATYNLLEAMRKHNINRIAFTSSSTVYGEAKVIPTPEDYAPLLPVSLYGASKLAAEALISAYTQSFNFQSWIFRFANIIGTRATHGIIHDFLEKLDKNPHELEILGDGRQNKSYLHVTECIDSILFALEKTRDQKQNIFNIGSEDQITATRIAEIVIEEKGLKNVKLKYTGGKRGWTGDIPIFRLSIEKLKNLGWKPRATSEEAVRRATRELIAEREKTPQN